MKNQNPSAFATANPSFGGLARLCQTLLQSMASRIICSAFVLLSAFSAVAQENTNKSISSETTIADNWHDEDVYIAQLKRDGIPGGVIKTMVAKRRQLILEERKIIPARESVKLLGQNPSVMAPCSDMGAETGWGSWTARIGNYTACSPAFGASGPPTAPRFAITSGLGTDLCTPGPALGSPTITVVAPSTFGFGNASIRLGELQTNGSIGGCASVGCIEELSYPLTVTPNDTNFVFAYAIVMENPAGHNNCQQPYVSLCITDSVGTPVDTNCACFKFVSGPGLPGFYTSACNVNSISYYQPWTLKGINLAKWIGKTINIVIQNADCSLSGHFAQSYWDFKCGTLSAQYQYCLNANATVLVAPSGGGLNYTYIWSTGQTTNTPSITVNPQPPNPDTITVEIIPPSGCGFKSLFVLKPTIINPAFTYTVNCNKVTFTDNTTITGGTINTWNWQFPGGNPSSSNLQSPGTVTYTNTGGTYNASLTVVSLAGCASTTVTVPVTIAPPPVANPGPNVSLCGTNTTMLCASGGGIGATYVWLPSNQPTTCITVTTANAGTHTLIVTDANGCTNSAVVSVTALPMPSVTAGPAATICLGQSSTILWALANPGGVSYSWSPGTGLSNPTIANPVASPNFSNTYIVTVTDVNGCSATDTVPITVANIPFVAAIASTTICPGDSAVLNANANNGTAPYSWYWSPPNPSAINNPNIQNPIATPVTTTIYTVTVTDANGCTDDTSTTVFVQTRPTAEIALWTPELSCDGYIVPFGLKGSSNVTSWYWDFGDGTSSTLQNPVHVYPFNGNYVVTVTVFNLPCSKKMDTTLIVSDMSGFINVLPANVFTPNNDNMNDCFHPAFTVQNIPNYTTADSLVEILAQCLTIEVYDRWGIKMFQSTDTEKCWNGKTLKGNPANEGTYYYVAKFGELTLKGYVTLLREK